MAPSRTLSPSGATGSGNLSISDIQNRETTNGVFPGEMKAAFKELDLVGDDIEDLDRSQVERRKEREAEEAQWKAQELKQDEIANKYGEVDTDSFVLRGSKAGFRDYDTKKIKPHVIKTYTEQHAKQTVEFNRYMRDVFMKEVHDIMTIVEAMHKLDEFVDESDPDTELGQIEHLLQSAEAVRKAGLPDWMQVTALIHDLGKLLFFFAAKKGIVGQWEIVGDTFPVGCRWSDRIVLREFGFDQNPDTHDPRYNTKYGIYHRGIGLENVMLSWGHDEYLYHVVKDQSELPPAALAMIRYHSFYPWHCMHAYRYLMNDDDIAALKAVEEFNPFDLYSKADERPNKEELMPYYEGLINKYFPKGKIVW